MSLCFLPPFPSSIQRARKRELETSHSCQAQGIAQAAPDEHLGRAILLPLSLCSLGSVSERGHQAPQTLGLSQGTLCSPTCS